MTQCVQTAQLIVQYKLAYFAHNHSITEHALQLLQQKSNCQVNNKCTNPSVTSVTKLVFALLVVRHNTLQQIQQSKQT